MWSDTRVLITGGTGMVAQAIKGHLAANYRLDVRCPGRSELDLEDKGAVATFFADFKPKYVFHLAGKVHGLGGNLMYPLETLSSNVLINDSVLSACAQDSVKKIFFAGTVASYQYPYAEMPLTEASLFAGEPHGGEYGYAMAKRLAHAYLTLLHEKFGKEYVYGVYTNLYGPHDRFNIVSGHVVPSLISKLSDANRRAVPFAVWGKPETTRDFMYVDDAAAAAVFLMERSHGIFNIASGVESSMQDLVNALLKASDFSGHVQWESSKPVGISRRFSNVDRLTNAGFRATTSLEQGIGKTWRWHEKAIQNNEEIRI